MIRRGMLVIAVGLAGWAQPGIAQERGNVGIGVALWGHATDLEVVRATDFDGSDETSDERPKDWDVVGSGLGIRLHYELPAPVVIYGEAGAARATVRDRDLTDPDLDLVSRGLDGGYFFAFGMRAEQDFSGTENLFWVAGMDVGLVSADLDEDIDRSWDYRETTASFEGAIGARLRQVGFFGGLRVNLYDAELEEIRVSNPPGTRVRTIELERDRPLDVLLGARTSSPGATGSIELGFFGTFSARAALSLRI